MFGGVCRFGEFAIKPGGSVSDQGKWFKLWGTSLYDEALQNLSLEDWARWARLGTYVKVYGCKGKIRFRAPFYALKELLRVQDEDTLRRVLASLPHLTFCNGSDTVTISVEFKNWNKYQGDFSRHRVEKHRSNVTATYQKNVTAQEEKRREENKKRLTTPQKFIPPTPEQATAYARELGFELDGMQFVSHYAASNWMRGKTKISDWRACVQTWKKNVTPKLGPPLVI